MQLPLRWDRRAVHGRAQLWLSSSVQVVTEACGPWEGRDARALEKAPKTLGLGAACAFIQTFGRGRLPLAKSPTEGCRVEGAGCLFPMVWPDQGKVIQEALERRELPEPSPPTDC